MAINISMIDLLSRSAKHKVFSVPLKVKEVKYHAVFISSLICPAQSKALAKSKQASSSYIPGIGSFT